MTVYEYVVVTPTLEAPKPKLYLPTPGAEQGYAEYIFERRFAEVERPLGFTSDMRWKD